MDNFFNNNSRQKIKITILATYTLVRQSLEILLNEERELSVLDAVGTTSDLLDKVSARKPDVVLLCLMENEGKNIKVLSKLFKVSPETKVVVLSSPNSSLDQPEALKLGVTGIVGINQNSRSLVRVIRQVADGEVGLNQKLLSQLLDTSFNESNGKRKNKRFTKGDDLTNREIEVISMIGLGMNNKDIAKKMFISEATVRHHLSSIYGKLNIEDRLNLAIYAYQHGIVPAVVNSI
jgi:DNA-binding NarL/FixJ family response regulator